MKKFILLLISIFACVGMCFADDIGPSYVVLSAIITNDDGAYVYDYNGDNKFSKTDEVLEKGTEIRISWSYEYKGTNYYKASSLNSEIGEFGFIKESDFVVTSYANALKDIYKKSDTYYIYDASKVVLREGPSSLYDEIDVEIPNNVEVKSDYNIDDLYVRIDINGTKGWVLLDDNSLAHKEGNKLMAYKSKTTVYSYPSSKKALKIDFPITGNFFESLYGVYDSDYNYFYAFLGNDGNLYWASSRDLIDYYEGKFKFGANTYLYSDVNLTMKISNALKQDSVISKLYYGWDASGNDICYFPGDDNNKNAGYVDCDYVYDEGHKNVDNFRVSEDLFVYTDITLNEFSFTVDAGTVVSVEKFCEYDAVFCESKYRVTYDDQVGWVSSESSAIFYSVTDDDYSDPIIDDDIVDDDYVDDDYVDDDYVDDEYHMSTKEYIILGVFGAIVLALSSFVTIKCINKSKKKDIKQDEVKTDVNTEVKTEEQPKEVNVSEKIE